MLDFKRFQFRTIVILSFFVLGSCNSKTFQLQGVIQDERYYDPQGLFSVPISKSYCYKIEEFNTGYSIAAIFHDDMGNLKRFEVVPCPDDIYTKLILNHNFEEVFRNIFEECCMAGISRDYPGTKKVEEEFIAIGSDKDIAYFAMIEIPRGSTLVDTSSGMPLDGTRGYLISMVGKQLVVMSFQESPCLVKILKTYKTNNDIKEIFKKILLEMQLEYRNENN
jgi:hypothetical protein